MTPSNACAALVQQFEGCEKPIGGGHFKAYPDPGTGAEPWTIGWGSTGADIGRETVWTQAQCDARLTADLARFGTEVSVLLGCAATTQHQLDALTCFAYNVGVANLQGSTLLKLHKAGDHTAAAREFLRWNRAGGKVMNGLTKRRSAEAVLYGRP